MDYLQYIATQKEAGVYKEKVLNLVINGLPSILKNEQDSQEKYIIVLNLVINGLPSILQKQVINQYEYEEVLNLVINGLPSILHCR